MTLPVGVTLKLKPRKLIGCESGNNCVFLTLKLSPNSDNHFSMRSLHSCKYSLSWCKEAEKKEFLEQLIVDTTITEIMKPGVIKEIAHKVAELAHREFNDKSRLISLQDQLKSVQTAIRNLLRLVEQGIDTDDVGDRLLDLNAQKADLQKQITKEEIKKPLISEERIEFWLTDLLTNGSREDPEYQQRIIDTLVNKVYVFDTDGGGRKIVVTYNTSNNTKSELTLSDAKGIISSNVKGFARPKFQI